MTDRTDLTTVAIFATLVGIGLMCILGAAMIPQVTLKQSFQSRLQVAAHNACAKANVGASRTHVYTVLGPQAVQMKWDVQVVPHPDFCEAGSVPGVSCYVGMDEYTLTECALD